MLDQKTTIYFALFEGAGRKSNIRKGQRGLALNLTDPLSVTSISFTIHCSMAELTYYSVTNLHINGH